MQITTAADTTMQTLLTTVKSGWPDNKDALPACLHPYWSIRDELSHDKGLFLKGDRIIVSTACRKNIRESLHESAHLGIDSCLHRARDTVYWPGMNVDLKQYIQYYPTCTAHQPAQHDETCKNPCAYHKQAAGAQDTQIP